MSRFSVINLVVIFQYSTSKYNNKYIVIYVIIIRSFCSVSCSDYIHTHALYSYTRTQRDRQITTTWHLFMVFHTPTRECRTNRFGYSRIEEYGTQPSNGVSLMILLSRGFFGYTPTADSSCLWAHVPCMECDYFFSRNLMIGSFAGLPD